MVLFVRGPRERREEGEDEKRPSLCSAPFLDVSWRASPRSVLSATRSRLSPKWKSDLRRRSRKTAGKRRTRRRKNIRSTERRRAHQFFSRSSPPSSPPSWRHSDHAIPYGHACDREQLAPAFAKAKQRRETEEKRASKKEEGETYVHLLGRARLDNPARRPDGELFRGGRLELEGDAVGARIVEAERGGDVLAELEAEAELRRWRGKVGRRGGGEFLGSFSFSRLKRGGWRLREKVEVRGRSFFLSSFLASALPSGG